MHGAAEALASPTTWQVLSSSTACSTLAAASSASVRFRRPWLSPPSFSFENKIQEFGVGSQFRVLYDRIVTPGDGLIIFQGMVDATAESIKSLEGYNIAWVEEAQTLSQRSLALLRPTLRADGSEIWFSWNPRRKSDAVDQFLRGARPDNAIVVKANWRDNPWFSSVLEGERHLDLSKLPDRYHHTWEGDYSRYPTLSGT